MCAILSCNLGQTSWSCESSPVEVCLSGGLWSEGSSTTSSAGGSMTLWDGVGDTGNDLVVLSGHDDFYCDILESITVWCVAEGWC